MGLLSHLHRKHYLLYGILAAAFYCTCIAFYCRDASFRETWLLFTGNLLFLVIISASLFAFNKQRENNASTVSMLTAGHITVLTGILFSCIACFVILLLYVPGLLHAAVPGKILKGGPANIIKGKTNGMVFMIFMDAIMGNFVSGSAASILFSFSLKGNQTSEEVPPEQSEL